MAKISIIIPAYNTEKYIRKCLDSALSQTLRDIEIIVINDCSTDNTLSIIKTYSQKDGRIKIVDFLKNMGNGYGRNEGLKIARGDFIMFLDSDDWLEVNAAETLYYTANKSTSDLLLFGHRKHFELSKLKKKSKEYLPQIELDRDDIYSNFLLITQGVFPMPWPYFYSRKFILSNNISFPTDIYFEDIIFVAKAIFYAQNIMIYANNPLYNYRVRKNSIVQSFSKKKIDDNFTVHFMLRDFMKEVGIFEEYKDKYTARLLACCVSFCFSDYLRMPEEKRDEELEIFMEKVRKSDLLTDVNIETVKKFSKEIKDKTRAKQLERTVKSLLIIRSDSLFKALQRGIKINQFFRNLWLTRI